MSNRGVGKVHRSLIDFLCLDKMTASKTKFARCEVRPENGFNGLTLNY